MTHEVPVIDLFSGPGGLAEGFAGYREPGGNLRFRIALSVEMEPSAHRTLVLRAFLRKFPPAELPMEYYDFLNRGAKDEPDWRKLYPEKWLDAGAESLRLKLGTSEATSVVMARVQQIRRWHGGRTVLLGGPPCQSYSLVGRARNAGNAAYDPNQDKRQFLYRDYVKVLEELQPAVAIMENVKGMLSARHQGQPIFRHVMASLRDAGATCRYRLYALTPRNGGCRWEPDQDPKDFLVRAEEHGVPQARHRVFVVCVRRDVADLFSTDLLRLEKGTRTVSVDDVIGGMPVLRSRLSRGDSGEGWKAAVASACRLIRRIPRPAMTQEQESQFDDALVSTLKTTRGALPPYGDAVGGTGAMACPSSLRHWIVDMKLCRLPNNEARGHMAEDLARYLFAAAFARAKGRSPKSADFPMELAPNHANWGTGKFGDRFRVQVREHPSRTVTSHISKDGHYFIHPDPAQCRSLTVREAARLQTFPDNYFFCGGRTQQYVQVGNAVPPYLAQQIAGRVSAVFDELRGSEKRFATVAGGPVDPVLTRAKSIDATTAASNSLRAVPRYA